MRLAWIAALAAACDAAPRAQKTRAKTRAHRQTESNGGAQLSRGGATAAPQLPPLDQMPTGTTAAQQLSPLETMLAGSCARLLAQTVLHPLDVLRTRTQAKDVVGGVFSPAALLYGLVPQVALSAPAGALQFVTIGLVLSAIDKKLGPAARSSVLAQLSAAAIGTALAAVVRVPQELLKCVPRRAPRKAEHTEHSSRGGVFGSICAKPKGSRDCQTTRLQRVWATARPTQRRERPKLMNPANSTRGSSWQTRRCSYLRLLETAPRDGP
ncbi:hypothetical protein M885DRAFT_345856 [Pelagophyceae sp. CCMP2097]|nr:hypothetical protein M885DRAFT_345856 [Pelagophyceae sp. CCMP2097]